MCSYYFYNKKFIRHFFQNITSKENECAIILSLSYAKSVLRQTTKNAKSDDSKSNSDMTKFSSKSKSISIFPTISSPKSKLSTDLTY